MTSQNSTIAEGIYRILKFQPRTLRQCLQRCIGHMYLSLMNIMEVRDSVESIVFEIAEMKDYNPEYIYFPV